LEIISKMNIKFNIILEKVLQIFVINIYFIYKCLNNWNEINWKSDRNVQNIGYEKNSIKTLYIELTIRSEIYIIIHFKGRLNTKIIE